MCAVLADEDPHVDKSSGRSGRATIGCMKLRPGLRVLERGPGTLQFGVDHRWATVLDDLTPAERTVLRTLGPPELASTSTLLARCPEQGVEHARLDELLAALGSAGVLEPDTSAASTGSGTSDDVCASDHLRPTGHGRERVAARSRARVAVVGLGRLGLVVADVLASAGVGTVLADDERAVRAGDVGVGGLRERHVGLARGRAAVEVLGRGYPALRVGLGSHESPDVVVVVVEEVADPLRTVRLMALDVAHLVVTVREGDTVVGPFVVPGRTPCLTCLDLHRGDVDPTWPGLAVQLKEAAARRPPPQDSAVAAIAGALAAAQVLTYLDGGVPATTGTSIEVASGEEVPRLRAWDRHPACGCVGLARSAAGPPVGDLPRT